MRVKLEFPELKVFETTLEVRITDLNYGNHLGNDRMVGLLHEARAQWLKGHGFTELDLGGMGLIMADLAIQYQGEAFFGDKLVVELALSNWNSKSFQLFYRITCGSRKVAMASTSMLGFNYEKKSVVAFPETIRGILSTPVAAVNS